MNQKIISSLLCASLVFVQLTGLLLASNSTVQAQNNKNALVRGYRTGYSDGYMAGFRDLSENLPRNHEKHPEFISADRAYSAAHGSLEDFRDGYQQGFAVGYNAAYKGRAFDSAIPAKLARRGIKTDATAGVSDDSPAQQTSGTNADNQQTGAVEPVAVPSNISNALVIIPANTELIVEMLSTISTKESSEGDAFRARIVAPVEIEGAIVEGKIADLRKPGRLKRRAELQLSFDRIVLNQNRSSNINAMVVEALPDANNKNSVRAIDEEGALKGKSSLKSDAAVVGVTTGTGATIGGFAAGPVGVAVGAAIGGGVGIGSILVSRGKHVNLQNKQRLRIRTANETQIR